MHTFMRGTQGDGLNCAGDSVVNLAIVEGSADLRIVVVTL